ncbi:uncharacterized protein KGF55_000523 [Candida pseudojiufengensis]|uniref:uncharacterized protein n=1 Tax=Candida pseudojiufengensis TaxID=497109 RepID=UPI00222548C0|nr:uncharacterized protein KGF55_000523 [Candida pseudojiufengensis]KAI5966214.1 hypothetical protein KGF55_000523 [Candida pseudojiufengensis]
MAFGDKNLEPTEIYLQNDKIDIENLPKFTITELSKYNGKDKPQYYVAIKRLIYDVTSNSDSYKPGKGYNVFVGKDSSRLLGTSSLKLKPNEEGKTPESWDYSDFGDKELKVLNDWVKFFKMRYPIVGVVAIEEDDDGKIDTKD